MLRGFPTSPEGNCEAFLAHAIEGGSYDGLDLGGVSWDLSGRPAVFSRFGYSNVAGFEDA